MPSISNNSEHFSNEELVKLLDNLYQYNLLRDFRDDTIKSSQGIDYVVWNARVVVRRDGNCPLEGDIKTGRQYFTEPVKVEVIVYPNGRRHDRDGAFEAALYGGKNKEPIEQTDYCLLFQNDDITEIPFGWKCIEFMVDLIHPDNATKVAKDLNEAFPPIVDEKFMIINKIKKEVSYVRVFQCPKCFPNNSSKPPECKHRVCVYFTDGNHLMYFGSGNDLSAAEIEQKGYLPFARQFTPGTHERDKQQLIICDIGRKIGPNKQDPFTGLSH